MQTNFKKVFIQTLLVLVVTVRISFGNEVVNLTIDKTSMTNVAAINLYQNDDTIPFTVLDASLPKPWTLSADLETINGILRVHAAPVNALGQEGTKSPEVPYSGIPDGADITIVITPVDNIR